jgi:purine-binding chemotaxis protein CheW
MMASSATQITHSLCAIRVAGGLYGLESAEVREVLDWQHPTPVPCSPAAILGLIAFRGDVLPLLGLRSLLGLPAAPAGRIIVVDDRQAQAGLAAQFGLAVDRVEGILAVLPSQSLPTPTTVHATRPQLLRRAWNLPEGLLLQLETNALSPVQSWTHQDQSRAS